MLKFDIFSMRVALDYLASAAQVCPGVLVYRAKTKRAKKDCV